jgi:hypothetical protein
MQGSALTGVNAGKDAFKFSGGPVIFKFPARIPQIKKGVVIAGAEAYRFFKTLAGLFKQSLGKIQDS